MTQKHMAWPDIVKGIGILLVWFGHTRWSQGDIGVWIWSFHMPLFFFLSGMLLSPERYPSFRAYFGQKSRKLLWPYCVWSLLISVLGILLLPDWHSSDCLKSILAGDGPQAGLALWFVFTLFWTEIIFFGLLRLVHRRWGILLMVCMFSLIGYAFYRQEISLFWRIDVIFTSLTFYGLGYLSRAYWLIGLGTQSPTIWGGGALLFAGVHLLAVRLGGQRLDLICNELGNYGWTYTTALAGIGMVLFGSRFLNEFCKENRYFLPLQRGLIFFGKNSLIVLALHQFFGVLAAYYIGGGWMGGLGRLLVFALVMLLMWSIPRFAGFLLSYPFLKSRT